MNHESGVTIITENGLDRVELSQYRCILCFIASPSETNSCLHKADVFRWVASSVSSQVPLEPVIVVSVSAYSYVASSVSAQVPLRLKIVLEVLLHVGVNAIFNFDLSLLLLLYVSEHVFYIDHVIPDFNFKGKPPDRIFEGLQAV